MIDHAVRDSSEWQDSIDLTVTGSVPVVMTSSLSGAMTDSEEDQEINVDSGHEDGDEVDEDSRSCGGDSAGESAPLAFSISRLLGESTVTRSDRAAQETITSLYSHPAALAVYPGAGVIRVPAHRPAPPGLQGPPLGAPFPWLALDPALVHRTAAAAAASFASSLVKDRLSGQ